MAEAKISFLGKNTIICPVCSEKFKKEELLSGGGRMNAGILTDELHREYNATEKFGNIHPLIYPVVVCPQCLFSAYMSDFESIETEEVHSLELQTSKRIEEAKNLFPRYNFLEPRTIIEGILSYSLAIMSYDLLESSHQPIFKQGLSALRAAWLCNDYHKIEPNENFDYLRDIFYRKAQFFYREVIEAEKDGREFYEDIPHFGPDIDHNHGFDGVLFLSGLLEYKYGPKQNVKARIDSLTNAKITVSRIVGMGKSSKSKPSDFVENARNLHGLIKDELVKLGEEV
ncbi:MAG: DUF2225 domain-containing protein [Spirochaetales bacterium]|nr:DUF2225 domain-containing protein [Spirochaetales bacterium]